MALSNPGSYDEKNEKFTPDEEGFLYQYPLNKETSKTGKRHIEFLQESTYDEIRYIGNIGFGPSLLSCTNQEFKEKVVKWQQESIFPEKEHTV